jgi:hypothetical protein
MQCTWIRVATSRRTNASMSLRMLASTAIGGDFGGIFLCKMKTAAGCVTGAITGPCTGPDSRRHGTDAKNQSLGGVASGVVGC